MKRGSEAYIDEVHELPELSTNELDDMEDAPESAVETTEAQIVDQATAARISAELATEIAALQRLEGLVLLHPVDAAHHTYVHQGGGDGAYCAHPQHLISFSTKFNQS